MTLSLFEVSVSGVSTPLWQRMCVREVCGYLPPIKRGSGTAVSWAAAVPPGGISGAKATFLFSVPSTMYEFNADSKLLVDAGSLSVGGLAASLHFTRGGVEYLLAARNWDGTSTNTYSSLFNLSSGSAPSEIESSRITTAAAYEWEVCTVLEDGGNVDYFVVANFAGQSKVFSLPGAALFGHGCAVILLITAS